MICKMVLEEYVSMENAWLLDVTVRSPGNLVMSKNLHNVFQECLVLMFKKTIAEFVVEMELIVTLSQENLKIRYTHGLIKLFMAAMAYYINTLDRQSSGRGRCEPNYFKVRDLF